MPAASPRFQLTEAAHDAMASVRVIVVPTDDDMSDCLAAANQAATSLDRNITVVLYDRSSETWMDTPHPNGPYRASELGDEHTELASQLDEIAGEGVNALAWISTVPALTDILTAVQQVGADAVMLPAEMCDQTLMDRLHGRDSTAADVTTTLEQNMREPIKVFTVTGDSIDIFAVTSPTTGRGV